MTDLVSRHFGPRHGGLHGEVLHAGFAQGVQHLLLLVLSFRLPEALLLRCRLPLLRQPETKKNTKKTPPSVTLYFKKLR